MGKVLVCNVLYSITMQGTNNKSHTTCLDNLLPAFVCAVTSVQKVKKASLTNLIR